MTIKVSAGPPSTPLSRWRSEQLQERRRTELEHLRKQAEQWRTGLSGFVTVILTASLVSGRNLLTGQPLPLRVAIGVLLLTSVLATATGVFLSTRAAHGIPPRRPRRLSVEDLVLDDRLAARRGARDLRAAMMSAACCCS